MSDTNVNLSESDLAALAETRKWAWIRRKFIRTKRYRRQYARRMPAERIVRVSDIVTITVGPLIYAYGPIGSDNLL